MDLLIYIVISVSCFASGFMLGNLYEHKRGINRLLLDKAMKGWKETETEFLKLVDWMQEHGFMAHKDGSLVSPYQLKNDIE